MSKPKPGSAYDLLCVLQYVRGTLETLEREGHDVEVALAVVRDGISRASEAKSHKD